MKPKGMIALLPFLGGLVFGPRVWAFPAAPTLSDIASTQVTIGEKDYYDVAATLNGTGPAGPAAYNVPVKFLYPVDPDDCNGTGIVDLLNNSAMVLLAPTGAAQPPLASARARLTDAFLAKKGYSYVSAQWEKTRRGLDVIALFNSLFGTHYAIPSDTDQFAVILDTVSLVKDPPADLPGSPCPVSKVITYGMSASTVPIIALTQPGGPFTADFAARVDGILLDSFTSNVSPLNVIQTGVPKTIAISAETDVVFFRNDLKVRGETPDYRSYEIAGAAHVTRDQHDWDDILQMLPFTPDPAVRPNLARDSGVFRAMIEHLRRWITVGSPPPPSVALDGSNYASLPFNCPGVPIPGIADIPRDADGNALGGVRLPFLRTRLNKRCLGPFCLGVGAPLGAYNGVETQYDCTLGSWVQVALVTGTYIRDDDILARYWSHGRYVLGVTTAAQYAFGKGWILREDRNAYIRSAAQCVVGRIPTEDITQVDLKDCHSL